MDGRGADPASNGNPKPSIRNLDRHDELLQAVEAGNWRRAVEIQGWWGDIMADRRMAVESWIRQGLWDCTNDVFKNWYCYLPFDCLLQLVLKSIKGTRQLHGETWVERLDWTSVNKALYYYLCFNIIDMITIKK